jgi:cyclic pyranopterin phosphate synthase
MLDPAGRTVDYLRISITDRCNERCLYCMPEGFVAWKERAEILSYEELLAIAEVAVSLGVKKFRVTGGEPLVRRDAEWFVCELLKLPKVEVALSTNGLRLAPIAAELAAAGLDSVNISLDALTPEIYRRITGGDVAKVLDGINASKAAGISRVKLNAVLMRGVNESEIWPLLEFAARERLVLRFIELMPLSRTDVLSDANFFPIAEAKRMLAARTEMIPTAQTFGNGPAVYYQLPQLGSSVGFIGALSDLHFCDRCNKMRVTCDGKLRPCLGNHLENDLMPALRPRIDPERLRELFIRTLHEKPAEHMFRVNYQPGRIMTAIGG